MSVGNSLFIAGVVWLGVTVVMTVILLVRRATGKRHLDQYIKDNY